MILSTQAISRLLSRLRVMFRALLSTLYLSTVTCTLRRFFLLRRIILCRSSNSFLLLLTNCGGINEVGLVFFRKNRSIVNRKVCLLSTICLIVPPNCSRRVITMHRRSVCHFSLCTRVTTLRFSIISCVRNVCRFPRGFVSIRLLSPIGLSSIFLRDC